MAPWELSLDGKWQLLEDPADDGLDKMWSQPANFHKAFEASPNQYMIAVPGNFNTLPPLFHYAGIVWYSRTFRIEKINIACPHLLKFQGVNYACTVWVNGQHIGSHEGGFLPFELKVSPAILRTETENVVVVRVDSYMKRDRIPGESADWFNWGGIHRSVSLQAISPHRIENLRIIPSFATSAPQAAHLELQFQIRNFTTLLSRIHANPQFTKQISLRYRITPKATLRYPDASALRPPLEGVLRWENLAALPRESLPNANLFRKFELDLTNPLLWHPNTPYLYELSLELELPADGQSSGKVISAKHQFGIRTVHTHGANLYLNHRPFKMQGVSLHEEQEPYGRHYPREMRLQELQEMKAMGFNAFRSAHYTHDEVLCGLCDEVGLVLLEEIPVYWNIQFSYPPTMKLAFRMVYDMVKRDFNHPSVISWSVGNEIPVENHNCRQAATTLMKWARKLDPTRLVTYASCRMTSDLLRPQGDVSFANFYFGWYYLSTKHLGPFLDILYYSSGFGQPLVITEFGAGAKYQVRDPAGQLKYSEDAQAQCILDQIQTMNSKPYLAGWFIWNYRDFRSPLRLNQYQQGFNRKGIVSEKNEKKLVARVLPKYIRSTKSKRRGIKVLAFLWGNLLKLIEFWVVSLLFRKEYNRERQLVDNYYHPDPTRRRLDLDTV